LLGSRYLHPSVPEGWLSFAASNFLTSCEILTPEKRGRSLHYNRFDERVLDERPARLIGNRDVHSRHRQPVYEVDIMTFCLPDGRASGISPPTVSSAIRGRGPEAGRARMPEPRPH